MRDKKMQGNDQIKKHLVKLSFWYFTGSVKLIFFIVDLTIFVIF